MEPIRKEEIDKKYDADVDNARRVLLEIAEDARGLKDRYPSETIVPEGGE